MAPNILALGNRVLAKDGAGSSFTGYLHHAEGQQFYVLPDARRQPFYAFPNEIVATGGQQPGFVPVDYPCGVDSAERQRVFVAHMKRNFDE